MSTNKKLTQIQLAGTTYDIDLQEDLKLKAQGYSVGLNYEINPTAESYSVCGRGNCTDAHIKIPSYYKGLPVTNIRYDAFYGDLEIRTVSIPNTIQTIEASAFSSSMLSEVYFADGCHDLTIEDYAFAYTPIREITLPTVRYLGIDIFESSSLEYCYLPKLDISSDINQPFGGCGYNLIAVYLDEEYYNKNKLSLEDKFSTPLSNIIPISDLVTKQTLLDNCLKYGGTISDGNGTIQPSTSLRNAIYHDVIAQYINNDKLHSYATDLRPEDITASGIFSILRPSNDYPAGDAGYPQIYYCITDTGKINALIGSNQTTYGVLKLANYSFRCTNSFQVSTNLSNLLSVSTLKPGDLLYAVDDRWEYTISGIKALKEGEANNSLVINEGTASGNTSIAGGTTDKSLISGLVGDLGAAITTLHPSEARGDLSIALGADNISNTAGAITLGYDNMSGGKGYYFDTFEGNTIKLSNTRRTSSLISPTYPSSVEWTEGDRLFMINDQRYWLTITNVEGNLITVAEDIGEVAYTPTLTVFTYSKPNDRTIINVDKPEAGVVAMGWGAIGIGTQNTVVGSNAYALGYKNIIGGDFGVALGQENVVGYTSLAAGIRNKALGKTSLVTGANNEAHGKEVFITGEENVVKADRSMAAGSNHIVNGNAYNAVFGISNRILETSEGHELLAGWNNEITAGGYGAIIGVRGKNIAGNHNIIFGRDNTNTAGARNLISGDVNEVISGNQNIITGKSNKVTGSNNNVSGESNTNVNGHQNILGGYLNTNDGRNNIVFGESNTNAGSGVLIGGKENTASGSYHLIQGTSNTVSTTMHGLAVFGVKNAVVTDGSLTSKAVEGLELIVGDSNKIHSGGYGAIIGSRNKNIEGNQNFITGADNSCKGARNILGGYLNSITSGDRNIVSGYANEVRGSNNIVSGSNNIVNSDSTKNCLIIGSNHTINGTTSNAIVCGHKAYVTDYTLFAVGNGIEEDRDNILEVQEHTVKVDGELNANWLNTSLMTDTESRITFDGDINLSAYHGVKLNCAGGYFNASTWNTSLELNYDNLSINCPLRMTTSDGKEITLTADKLAKIIKFIDSIEEVIE